MFDIGWTELLLIGVVALIVIGPKELPGMFRTMGRFTAKARSMARDFQRAMESAADEAGVKDVAKDLKSMTSAKSMGLDALKGAASKFEAFDPLKTKPGDVVRQAAASITAPAAAPAATAAKGPATQALADAQAARRAARAEAAAAKAAPAPAAPADLPEPAAVKSTRAAKTAKTAEVVRAALEGKKTARKPAAPKGEA